LTGEKKLPPTETNTAIRPSTTQLLLKSGLEVIRSSYGDRVLFFATQELISNTNNSLLQTVPEPAIEENRTWYFFQREVETTGEK